MALVLLAGNADDSSGFAVRRAMEIEIIAGGSVGPAVALNLHHRPFGNLDDFISQQELRALPDRYKRTAGYNIEELAAVGAATAI